MPAPSPFYRQHHQVEAPRVDAVEYRPAWRKTDHLRALHDASQITRFEYGCGLAFRHAAEHAAAAAWPPPIWLGAGGRRRGTGQLTMLAYNDELALLGRVEAVLGPFACGLLEACLIFDFTWQHLADCRGVDPRTVRAWTVLAIKALARVFSTTSTKGE
jgi:hypothetical protein